MSRIPTLETRRLRLRPMRMEDWPLYAELMASPRSIHMGGPHDARAAWGMFCHDAAQWSLMGHGALMIEEKVSGHCLGQVAVNAGPLFPEHELGWYLYGAAEGRGYALEAAKHLRDWAFETLGLETLVSYIEADNVPSCRLAERLDAKLDPHAPRPDPTDLVYRHCRS